MSDDSVVASFQPTDSWYRDWPHGVDTSVQVQASISGPDAANAVQEFLKSLKHDPDVDVPDGVSQYYWGGFAVAVTAPADDGTWRIVLASAGEDGFDSVEDGADALVGALRSTPGAISLTWHELPATRINGAPLR